MLTSEPHVSHGDYVCRRMVLWLMRRYTMLERGAALACRLVMIGSVQLCACAVIYFAVMGIRPGEGRRRQGSRSVGRQQGEMPSGR